MSWANKEIKQYVKDLHKEIARLNEVITEFDNTHCSRDQELINLYEKNGYLRGKTEAYETMLKKRKMIESDKERIIKFADFHLDPYKRKDK